MEVPLKEIKKICCQFEWWNRDLILLIINPVRGWDAICCTSSTTTATTTSIVLQNFQCPPSPISLSLELILQTLCGWFFAKCPFFTSVEVNFKFYILATSNIFLKEEHLRHGKNVFGANFSHIPCIYSLL